MGWFFGRNKKEDKRSFPELSLPEFKDRDFPLYEPNTPGSDDIKRAVAGSEFSRVDVSRILSGESSKPGDKPLFVKIEKYKDTLSKLHIIKGKLEEAEAVLMKVEELKTQEDLKLKEWKQDIELIKEKLLEIDQMLYE